MRLVLFEVRQWLKSPVFWAMLLIVTLFAGSELTEDSFFSGTFAWPEPPVQGLVQLPNQPPPYGIKQDNSTEQQIQYALRELYLAAHGNDVLVPALGGFINRKVKLSEGQRELVREAFFMISGKQYDTLDYYDDFPVAISHTDFSSYLDALNESLGEKYFTLDSQIASYVPRTYEDALADYDTLVNTDRVSRANARYYCDYMGIALGLMPALLAAFILGRDKRSGAAPLIASRAISGTGYLAMKYLGYIVPICIYALLISLIPTAGAVFQYVNGSPVDVFAYLSHTVIWLLPTILCTCALALLISEAAGSGIVAIPFIVGWWMFSVARPGLAGPYPLLVSLIRFNSTDAISPDWTMQIYLNRLFVTLLSFAMVALAGILHERKRGRSGRYV